MYTRLNYPIFPPFQQYFVLERNVSHFPIPFCHTTPTYLRVLARSMKGEEITGDNHELPVRCVSRGIARVNQAL